MKIWYMIKRHEAAHAYMAIKLELIPEKIIYDIKNKSGSTHIDNKIMKIGTPAQIIEFEEKMLKVMIAGSAFNSGIIKDIWLNSKDYREFQNFYKSLSSKGVRDIKNVVSDELRMLDKIKKELRVEEVRRKIRSFARKMNKKYEYDYNFITQFLK